MLAENSSELFSDGVNDQDKRLNKIPSLENRENSIYSTNHVYLHRPNAFGFWQTRLHLCYKTLKRVSNFSELA